MKFFGYVESNWGAHIDWKAKEVTFSHSFNWLWIYCQLQGLKNLHCADDNEKAWILFSYVKEHLVYIKPFQNAVKLIIIILWYFLHFHGLYGLYGPQCLLSIKRLLNLITLLHFYVFDIIFTICYCTNCSFFAISQICRIRKVYMSFSIWVCRTLFSRHVILMVGDVLVEIFWICGVQLRCPSIIRPQKLVCHSFNWLWIYCQLQGLKMMIMKKHEFCFLYIKGQLVYIKPFQNVVKLIVNILWYFLHFHGWTIWTQISAVPKKAIKLNHSATFSCFWHYIYYLLLCELLFSAINQSATFSCFWHYIYYLLLCELLFSAISQVCRIREVYISFIIWVCRTLFIRHVILMVRDILFEIFWICRVQLRCPHWLESQGSYILSLFQLAMNLLPASGVKEFTLRWW